MFISQMEKENGSLTKIKKKMKPSDLIYSSSNEINKKLSTTSHSISDLMWKSISTSILCPTLYFFQDSVGHLAKHSIWRSTQNSSKIIISNLNEKHSHSPVVSNE